MRSPPFRTLVPITPRIGANVSGGYRAFTPPDEPQPDTINWECMSIEGSAVMCGFSGYDDGSYNPASPGSWSGQFRKWTGRQISGDIYFCGFMPGFGCSIPLESGGFQYSGTVILTCDGITQYAQRQGASSWGVGCVQPVYDGSVVNVTQINTVDRGSSTAVTTVSKTLTSLTVTGNEECFTSQKYFGENVESLVDEVNLYDVMLSGNPEAPIGSECCATTESGTLAEPESQASITIVGRVVRLRIATSIDEPAINVNVMMEQDGDVIISPIQIVGGGADNFFDVPQPRPGEAPICVTDVVFA